MAKKTKLSEKNPTELVKMLAEKREALRKVRFAAAGARPKNSNEPKETRKEIARILTEIGSREKTV